MSKVINIANDKSHKQIKNTAFNKKRIMPKKEYTTLPKEYPVCMHSSCPMATTCLHQKAYFTMMEQDEFLRLRLTSDNIHLFL